MKDRGMESREPVATPEEILRGAVKLFFQLDTEAHEELMGKNNPDAQHRILRKRARMIAGLYDKVKSATEIQGQKLPEEAMNQLLEFSGMARAVLKTDVRASDGSLGLASLLTSWGGEKGDMINQLINRVYPPKPPAGPPTP